MKNQYDFMAGIHFGGELYFNKYSMIIDFYSDGESMQDQNTGIDRLGYFVYEIVQRSVFVQEDDLLAIKGYVKAGIPVLTVAGPGPFDPIILATLVTKMNAILEDTLVISDAEITSAVGGLMTYVWDSTDDDDEVHEIVADDDEVNWWASPAPRFLSYPVGSDVDEIEAIKPFPLTWEALGFPWMDEDADKDTDENEFMLDPSLKKTKKGTGGKVIKADFTSKTKNPK